MKKLVTGILAMLLCFGCLAGCGDSNSSESSSSTPEVSTPDASTPDESTPDASTPDESTPDASTPDESTPDTSSPDDGGEVTPQPHEADLKDVKDFIYSPMLDEATESTKSYTVKNSYSFYQEEAVYDIAWAVTDADGNAINGVTIEEGEAEDTVVISETLPETVSYVLTGTISCPDGCCSLSFTLNRVAVAAPAPVAITEAPVEGTAYKFYVYQGNKKVDCYPTGNMKNTYYFETTTDYAASLDFFVENVEGGFHLYHVADGVKIYINVVKSGTHTNAKYQTIEENASPNVWTFNTEWKTITTTLSDGTYYLGCDGSYDTVEPQYKVEDGYFMGYLVTMVDKSQIVITDETKVNTIKDSLNVVTKHTLDKTVSLTTSDDRYPEVSIVWTVEEGKGATVTADGLVLAIPAEATTAVLTATVSCGEVTETKEFTLELGPKTEAPDATNAEAIVNAAFNLAAGETLPGESYTLTGVIKNVKTPYSADYKNVTVIITIGEKEIECYRLKGEGADVIKAGDTITVTGKIKNYNGTVEFDQGCTLDSYTASEGGETPDVGGDEEPSVQAPAADSVLTIKQALAYGNTLTAPTTDKYYVSGTITGFYGNGGKTYGNVYIQDENGDSILVYGLYSADGSVRYDKMEVKPVEGDTIKVYGALTSYNGVGQFKDAWLIEHTPAAGGETPDVGGDEEPSVQAPAADSVLTIKEALAYGNTLTAATTDKYYVSGKITGFYGNGGKTYGNVYIQDENGDSILVYGLYSADGSVRYDKMEVKPVEGDTIKVYGVLSSYNGVGQFKDAWLIEHTPAAGDEGSETPDEPTTGAYTAVATFTFGANGDAAHKDGSDIQTTDFTDGNYTLSLKDCVKVYEGAYDAKGNSCLKLSSSKAVASFSFTVADDVDCVVFRVAQYKSNATKITINGTEYEITTASDNGEYTEIVIDTTEVKTISVLTVKGTHRVMIDAIIFGVNA